LAKPPAREGVKTRCRIDWLEKSLRPCSSPDEILYGSLDRCRSTELFSATVPPTLSIIPFTVNMSLTYYASRYLYSENDASFYLYISFFCENPPVTVFDPNRKRNARGEQRQRALLRAAAATFGRLGYHQTTTNAIAAEARVSPATLYQFFPNKEAIASALASMYAHEMAEAERAIDPEGVLSFTEAVGELIDVCMSFNRKHPEFHTLVVDAPLSPSAREDKQVLGQVFVDFITARLRRELPTLARAEAAHHGQVALMIFHGILDELTAAPAHARPRLQQAMRNAILRYLTPVLTETKAGPLG
jgi:AcrR family transcriptional regulator